MILGILMDILVIVMNIFYSFQVYIWLYAIPLALICLIIFIVNCFTNPTNNADLFNNTKIALYFYLPCIFYIIASVIFNYILPNLLSLGSLFVGPFFLAISSGVSLVIQIVINKCFLSNRWTNYIGIVLACVMSFLVYSFIPIIHK